MGFVFDILKESFPRGRKSSLIRFSAGKAVVECAFCRGSGVDAKPKHSVCPVCGGSRVVRVEPPAVTCVFCRGAGQAPWGGNLTCPVCFGKGVVSVLEPIETCPNCRGTGANPTGRLYCMNCRGKGAVTAKTK